MKTRLLLCLVGFAIFAGCGDEPSRPAVETRPALDAPPPPPPLPVVPSQAEVVRKKAEVGVGAKGRGYGAGPVATPAAAYFSTRERIVFDIQVPEAMKLYQALEGGAPKTHEEFMEKIIRANNIKLPELPPGHRYVYDPAEAQLMVEQAPPTP